MELTTIQFLTGLFSLILSIISIYVGLYIASRYRKYNNKILLYVGLSWVGLYNGWWPSAINFILIITTGTILSEVPVFIIGNILLPWWFLLWMVGVTELLYKEKQKMILVFVMIFAFLYDGVLLYYSFTDPSKVGELQGPVDVKYTGLVALFLIVLLFLVFITGVLFARESLKSQDKKNKLRGKFIIYAFTSWLIGAIIDASIELTLLTLPLIRIFIISSTIAFYIGILMPKFVQKAFLGQDGT